MKSVQKGFELSQFMKHIDMSRDIAKSGSRFLMSGFCDFVIAGELSDQKSYSQS